MNFFFFYHLSGGNWAAALADAAAAARPRMLIATGSGARRPEELRRALAQFLDALGGDAIDVFFIEYVHPAEDPELVHGDHGALAELARWKRQGTIRYVGASAHDRAVSRRLAEDPRLDVLMQRYNMAHRKVADEVFPACRDNGVALISFTATRWGSLMKGHPDWPDEPPSALDCYRFCAACPDVDVVLAAPANRPELQENLALLHAPPMTADEIAHWRRYGDLVYGDGSGSFETDWP